MTWLRQILIASVCLLPAAILAGEAGLGFFATVAILVLVIVGADVARSINKILDERR